MNHPNFVPELDKRSCEAKETSKQYFDVSFDLCEKVNQVRDLEHYLGHRSRDAFDSLQNEFEAFIQDVEKEVKSPSSKLKFAVSRARYIISLYE